MDSTRPSKPRRRSRYGCRNCKLRKVKCDESKPQCRQCITYGVLCNFLNGVKDVKMIANDVAKWPLVPTKVNPERCISQSIWTADTTSCFEVDSQNQFLLDQYLGQNLTARNDPNTTQMNRGLLKLAFMSPALMHASLAVALSYGQYLHGMSGKQLATEYYYHWFQSVKLFNKSLDGSLLEINKDSLWGTAAALAMLSFASATSQSQEDLSISHVVALEWLYMDEGKMSLWQLVNPLRPESIFSVMVETYAQMNYPFPTRGVGTMSKRLAAMCALDGNSTSMTNSYFFAAHAVWDILALHNTEITVGHTERFAHSICGRFRILFLAMDPIALVLLCLWLRKAGCSIWWIQCRADLECPLIYAYLDQHFKSHSAVLTALLDEYIGSPYSGKQ